MPNLLCARLYPGGNTTILVLDPVPRALQPASALQIMRHYPDVEQVGFLEPSSDPRALARLQMAGGEFCGNATRSLAWLIAHGHVAGVRPDGPAFALEVSGARELVPVEVAGDVVSVQMPIRRSLDCITEHARGRLVALDGITHLVATEVPPEDARPSAVRRMDEMGLRDLPSAGVIFCRPWEDGVAIVPVIWVRATGTLVQETACGSGSVAVALERAARQGTTLTGLRILQPSGGVIACSVVLDAGAFASATIEGPVALLATDRVQVQDNGDAIG